MAGSPVQDEGYARHRTLLEGILCEVCRENEARYGNVLYRDESAPLVCSNCYARKRRTGRYLPMIGPRYNKSQDWRDDAACKDAPIELFFPKRGGSGQAAREMCARCPVRSECLDFILSLPGRSDEYGIWAGMNPRERALERVNRRRRKEFRKGLKLVG